MQTTKVITNAAVARKLIQLGFPPIDIKPAKDNPIKTSFVFEYTPLFHQAWLRVAKLLNVEIPEVAQEIERD